MEKCKDCNGTGKYIGLLETGACLNCNGSGIEIKIKSIKTNGSFTPEWVAFLSNLDLDRMKSIQFGSTGRRTGRTTKMFCHALSEMFNGKKIMIISSDISNCSRQFNHFIFNKLNSSLKAKINYRSRYYCSSKKNGSIGIVLPDPQKFKSISINGIYIDNYLTQIDAVILASSMPILSASIMSQEGHITWC